MPSVQVKIVPAEVLEVHRRRAKARHQSLQAYLLERLTAEARQPTMTEVFARVDAAPRVPIDIDVLNRIVGEDRDSH